jgi:hypothetical protein
VGITPAQNVHIDVGIYAMSQSRLPEAELEKAKMKGTKLLRAGNASSHEEADAAADKAIAELEVEAQTTPPRRGKP